MNAFVVDANVLVVANLQADPEDIVCQEACVLFLEAVQRDGCVLLDDRYRILGEYGHNLDTKRQPGTGYAFFKWLHNRRGSTACVEVTISVLNEHTCDFAEFPSDTTLAGFDRNDRKYVAVARASGRDPEIANATDSDWAAYARILESHGVRIRFLCPHRCAPE